MVELVDLACGREGQLHLNLDGKPMEGNDVDDQIVPIFKLLKPMSRPITIKLSNEAFFEVFNFRCDVHATFDG
jgi:hypothetical protein